MAEQIPYSVAASLVNKLASLALREIGRIYGVKDELERLKDTVESIKAVLLDADKRQEQDHAVQLWIKRLKDALLAADDLFDLIAAKDLQVKVDGRNKMVKEVCQFFSPSNQIVFRRQMANKIEKIRQKLNDVAEDMSKLNLIPRNEIVTQTKCGQRETSCFVSESDIIGREDSKKEILNLLKQSHSPGGQTVSSIAIVGIGGLGKTAIAQLVYNDVQVQMLFDKRMWVCVSDNFDVKIIVKKILESIIGGENNNEELALIDKLSLDNLQNKFREKINGKRYLLVMDDVWNESHEKWNQLRTYLVCGAPGSKVLVTTRNQIVAQTVGASSSCVLKGLTTEQSWRLLKKLTFGDDSKVMNHTLELIGKEIVEKCRGVPLAIRAVAGILQSKDKESEWTKVLEGDFWKLCEEEDSIMPVLKLSYQDLSPELKQCFAYCTVYPKDWVIEKDELIQLWMAQGFLESLDEKQHMDDIGNQFVNTLLMKQFFQDVEIDKYGNVVCFKMHDLMHDLALLVAGHDCYLDCERQKLVNRPVHISLQSNAIDRLESLDGSRLRTLFGLWSSKNWATGVDLKELSLILNFECLRVLNLSNSSIKRLPDSVGELIHLRYLDLSKCNSLLSLPKSVSNLVNLQTLKLNKCPSLEFSTIVVTKLINLRSLEIDGCKAFDDMMPTGLGKLTSLQSLSAFVVGDGGKKKVGKLNELQHLNNLRGSLEIYRLGLVQDVMLESQEVNLKDKKFLSRIVLSWRARGSGQSQRDSLQLLENLRPHQDLKILEVYHYPGVSLCNWLCSHTNISTIKLAYCESYRYLPSLDGLPSLKSLDLQDMDALEYICFDSTCTCTVTSFFPSLERIRFCKCEKLRGWQSTGDDVCLPPFPRLSELSINVCPVLTCMPTFPRLDKQLTLYNLCTVKPLAETLNKASSSSFAPLSVLKSLEIGWGEIFDTQDLPKKWLQNLSSLNHLEIHGDVIEEFESWFEDDVVDLLPSLHTLVLDAVDPPALPNWVCKLQSLQNIKMRFPHLVSLPEGMRRLTNLQNLEIIGRPFLLERCKRETGADWPNIAHIPDIILSAW